MDILPGKLLLRIPEAAEALGLSRSTVYELVANGELTVVRVGRAIRIPVASLHAWIEKQVADSGNAE